MFWVALAAGPASLVILAAVSPLALQLGSNASYGSLLLAIAIYPPLEEWVFRGNLQPWIGARLAQKLGPLSLANIVTSLLFTALHFLYHPPLWAGAVLLPSLIFGFFRERHGHIGSAVTLHAGYNASYYLLLAA